MDSIPRKKIFFSIATIFMVVGVLELAGQIFMYIKSILIEPDKHAAIIRENGYVRMKPGFKHSDKVSGNTFSINSLGFRGQEISERKPKKNIRIVAIGGSTTFGIGSSNNSHTYPSLLENKLNKNNELLDTNFEVINAGIPGAKSINILNLFSEQILKMNPDILLIYSGWNDWNEFYNRGPAIFEYNSTLYRLNLKLSELSVLYSKLRNILFSFRGRIKKADYEERALKVLNQNYFEKPYKENIVNLLKICRDNNIQPILILQPPSLGSFTVLDGKKFVLKDPLFQEARKVMPIVRNRLMQIQKNISLENNTPIIDINYMFDGYDNGDSLYYDIIHFSDDGNGILAEGISRWILSDKNISFINNLKNQPLKLSLNIKGIYLGKV